MSSLNTTNKYTQNYSEKISILKEKIKSADAILIGAGAGLSSAAGFTYSGERFEKYFSDFEKKYGFHDMYAGGFYPYKTMEEFWAYWSRYIYINRYMDPPKTTYENLFNLVKDKNYFVLTTNVDHCFQKTGFDKNRIFYTQGDYGLFQCSEPCHQQTYDNEEIVDKMIKEQKEMKIPSELIPTCPECGKPMSMNLRSDETFVQDKGWYQAAEKYSSFVEQFQSSVLCLEFGVGFNTPGIIKYNFQSIVEKNKNAFYVCQNKEDIFDAPKSIDSRSLFIQADTDKVIEDLRQN